MVQQHQRAMALADGIFRHIPFAVSSSQSLEPQVHSAPQMSCASQGLPPQFLTPRLVASVSSPKLENQSRFALVHLRLESALVERLSEGSGIAGGGTTLVLAEGLETDTAL